MQLKKELAEKLKVKREIEDWLDEKVQIEFQLESGQARVRALNDELISNSKAFEREKYTLQTLIKKKNGLLDRISLTELAGQVPNEITLNSGSYTHIDNEIPIGRGEESS